MDDYTCGTVAAHHRHVRAGEIVDAECRAAWNAYMRERRSPLRVAYDPMQCRRCGVVFTPKRSDNGGYCTANCSSAHGQEMRRKTAARPCEWCLKTFAPHHNDAACCSRSCVHALQVLRRHGLTADEYRGMLDRQSGCCASCGDGLGDGRRDRHIDHDHNTGKVRGILCPPCNLMLGHAKDDPRRLRAAADYLDR